MDEEIKERIEKVQGEADKALKRYMSLKPISKMVAVLFGRKKELEKIIGKTNEDPYSVPDDELAKLSGMFRK